MTASRKRKRVKAEPRTRYVTDENGVQHVAAIQWCSRCDGTGLEPSPLKRPKRKARR